VQRWKLLVALAGLAVVVAGAVVLWPSRLTRENYDRIQNGMSRAEVYALLGPPDPDPFGTPGSGGEAWSRLDEIYAVFFDPSGRVCYKFLSYGLPRRTTQGPFDSLLWRAKRHWHRWFPE
jgi:hypothetical protein